MGEEIQSAARYGNHTKRTITIFTAVVLGLAVLAGVIDPLTVPPGAEPGDL